MVYLTCMAATNEKQVVRQQPDTENELLPYQKLISSSLIIVLPLPVEWDPQPRDDSGKEETVYLASLAWDSQEFKRVEGTFLQSLRGKASIKNIERIQNPSMFISYMLRKQTMDDKNGTLDNELHLFHGTAYDSVKAINVQGFNRSLCGRNGK